MALTGPPTWWDKAVGFRNKEGDKFPTLPPIAGQGATNSNRVSVSLCATKMGGFLNSSHSGFSSPHISTYITLPEELKPILVAWCHSAGRQTLATHQRNASKTEMVCTWPSHLVVTYNVS